MYQFNRAPVNFNWRSPYSFQSLTGLAPRTSINIGSDIVEGYDANGNPIVAGTALQPLSAGSNNAQSQPVVPTLDNGRYGDAIIQRLTFNGAGLPVDAQGNPVAIALARPNNTRTLLLIVNQTAGTVYYDWDRQAGTDGIPIPLNGNENFNSVVPQGNLSVYSSAMGIVLLQYINANVTA